MKVWHWFLNGPSSCFTVEPDVAALIQCLKLQATVFHCLIQLNMADTLTLHLNKQKQHIMISPAIMADWSDLVQGAVDLFSFMPIWMCVTASICITSVCMCVSGPIQTNGGGLGQRACSTARPLIAIYILAESLISNSPIICHTPITSPPSPLSDACVNVRARQCHQTTGSPIDSSPSLSHNSCLPCCSFFYEGPLQSQRLQR